MVTLITPLKLMADSFDIVGGVVCSGVGFTEGVISGVTVAGTCSLKYNF